jgi:hypothetical protein
LHRLRVAKLAVFVVCQFKPLVFVFHILSFFVTHSVIADAGNNLTQSIRNSTNLLRIIRVTSVDNFILFQSRTK